jgi:MoaA/NifB/PqqE/SkfB family radical SAM enzyme
MVDLTVSPVTDMVWLEVTSRCNLRCTYCHLSHEDVPEVDLDLAGFPRFVETLRSRHARELVFNGRGENSFLPGWHEVVRQVLDAGLDVTAVTNLSRVYADDELETFSRYGNVTVSVDTTDEGVFRSIRRKADIKLVLANIIRVRAIALAADRSPPEIVWNMIVHSHSMLRLAQTTSDGVAVGVGHFHLSVLGEKPEVSGAISPRQIDRFSCDELADGFAQINQAQTVAQRNGRRITMSPGLDSLIANLSARWNIERPRLEITG